MNPVPLADVSPRPGRNHHRVDRTPIAVAVIGAKIARIGGRLVEISLRGNRLALEFQHDDRAADQQQHVRAPEFERQLVLEDCAVLGGLGQRVQRLADLALQPRDALVPRSDLRRIHVWEEVLKSPANDARLRRVKGREVRAPAVARCSPGGRLGVRVHRGCRAGSNRESGATGPKSPGCARDRPAVHDGRALACALRGRGPSRWGRAGRGGRAEGRSRIGLPGAVGGDGLSWSRADADACGAAGSRVRSRPAPMISDDGVRPGWHDSGTRT